MWFVISLIAFFMLALAAVIDKFLLAQTKIVPVSFAFYISLGGIFGSILLIFEHNFYFPLSQSIILMLGGFALFFGLYFMFLAVAKSEVSKSNPIIVSFTPLFVFLLSLLFGLELVTWQRIVGMLLILCGGYLLSQVGSARARLNRQVWRFIIISSLMLGASNVFSKIAYDHLPFINAFVWLRWFTVLAAVLFVTVTYNWPAVLLKQPGQSGKLGLKSAIWILILGQVAGSLGVILLQYAIKLGNVILVTALNGVQFFFVIILIYFFSKAYPRVLQENISQKFIFQKIIWSLFLTLGVVLILI
ncbi:MAG: EamA family transporter [Candidatus Komeilibacteria bacterium]|nr:EamA family transporter [Candidatus Komeilibacteria bacterium]